MDDGVSIQLIGHVLITSIASDEYDSGRGRYMASVGMEVYGDELDDTIHIDEDEFEEWERNCRKGDYFCVTVERLTRHDGDGDGYEQLQLV